MCRRTESTHGFFQAACEVPCENIPVIDRCCTFAFYKHYNSVVPVGDCESARFGVGQCTCIIETPDNVHRRIHSVHFPQFTQLQAQSQSPDIPQRVNRGLSAWNRRRNRLDYVMEPFYVTRSKNNKRGVCSSFVRQPHVLNGQTRPNGTGTWTGDEKRRKSGTKHFYSCDSRYARNRLSRMCDHFLGQHTFERLDIAAFSETNKQRAASPLRPPRPFWILRQ